MTGAWSGGRASIRSTATSPAKPPTPCTWPTTPRSPSTSSPSRPINISRVKNRVRAGGPDVPADKVTPRYHRSLALLREAVKNTNRAYIFDNSSTEAEWIAEITDAEKLKFKTNRVPAWFSRLIMAKSDGRV